MCTVPTRDLLSDLLFSFRLHLMTDSFVYQTFYESSNRQFLSLLSSTDISCALLLTNLFWSHHHPGLIFVLILV